MLFHTLTLVDPKMFGENVGKEDTLFPHVSHINYIEYWFSSVPIPSSIQVCVLRSRYVYASSVYVYIIAKSNMFSLSVSC